MAEPFLADDAVTLYLGDCRELMAALDAESVDAIVTDPPYELNFMGKGWDDSGIAYSVEMWHEALRVLKPGGYLLSFGGTRTYHRMVCAIEDAGFEIRDSIHWVYGSGFPKSLDVSKAIDKAAGAQGARGPMKRGGERLARLEDGKRDGGGTWNDESGRDPFTYLPATPDAQKWSGWGTALKPAHEPIVVARKPLIGTVAANVLTHGTGAINVDGCRVGFTSDADERESKDKNRHADFGTEPGGNEVYGDFSMVERTNYDAPGRWPPNIILGPDAAAEMDRQSGVSVSTGGQAFLGAFRNGDIYGAGRDEREKRDPGFGDTGGASRFFPIFRYEAKASSDERPTIESDRDVQGRVMGATIKRCRQCGDQTIKPGMSTPACGHNDHEHVPVASRTDRIAHPTVKPVDLMRWLVRLVTPPGGTVLDPFAGSGTTGEACIVEGFKCVMIEQNSDYVKLIAKRMSRDIQPVLL